MPFRVWPDVGDPADIHFFLGFKAATGDFAGMTNLKAVLATGAGVDGIFLAEDVPDVAIARIIDPWMTEQMAQWALYAVLHFYRRFGDYQAQQAEGDWNELDPWRAAPARVGMLGCGEIGQEIGRRLGDIGFDVAGWTRSARDLGDIENFHGEDGFAPFLARSNFLICLLPLTEDTTGLLDAAAFSHLPEDAYLINMARGRIVDTDDLVDRARLRAGQGCVSGCHGARALAARPSALAYAECPHHAAQFRQHECGYGCRPSRRKYPPRAGRRTVI